MAVGRVVIVGAGPAGAALAYLLARRGVEVTLLERHSGFERTFRGDGLQPSGLDAFDQMGLGDQLRQLPKALVRTIDIYQGGRRRTRLAVESLGFIPCFIPQPAVLAMLTEQSRQHPSFQLHMGTAVRDLIRVGERVVGVRTDGSDGPREFAADLVIGTDGRYSMVRKRFGVGPQVCRQVGRGAAQQFLGEPIRSGVAQRLVLALLDGHSDPEPTVGRRYAARDATRAQLQPHGRVVGPEFGKGHHEVQHVEVLRRPQRGERP